MRESKNNATTLEMTTQKIRTKAARWLGVSPKRKEALYLDLLRAATLRDAVYWLQIFFSAGIATLGLVLNSAAVIIGAMLISPLMSPILAAGLAFGTGDLVLGLRSILKLFLSCVLAIGFAVLLVVFLPFREMTAEIAGRTQPNTLDLMIALFSGAIGSIATCREVKGVVTSIPGVAIAVALMPPLCVVGYGIGLMMIFDAPTGTRIATGGGLLFLTNLVAITFTAMLVFLVLQIDTPLIRKKAERWGQADAESRFIINSMRRFARLDQARKIHSVSMRFMMILIPLILIFIPLSRAFSQLQTEINQKQRENEIRRTVTDLWQKKFQTGSDGKTRSTIDQLIVSERDNTLNIYLRVFDDRPYTAAEKKQCAEMIAKNLNKPAAEVNFQLVEVPTTSLLDQIRERTEKPAAPPTVAELQASLRQQAQNALGNITLPAGATLLDKRITTSTVEPLQVKVIYLSGENIEPDVQKQIIGQIQKKLDYEGAKITLERIPTAVGEIDFARSRADIPVLSMLQLDFVGRILRETPQLLLTVSIGSRRGESEDAAVERLSAITDYLDSRWQIGGERIKTIDPDDGQTTAKLGFQTIDAAAVPAQTPAQSENANVKTP